MVGQRPETVHPQTNTLNLGAVDPGVALDPVGGAEREGDEDGDDDEGADGELAGQRPLPVNVRVGQDVVKLVIVFDGGRRRVQMVKFVWFEI